MLWYIVNASCRITGLRGWKQSGSFRGLVTLGRGTVPWRRYTDSCTQSGGEIYFEFCLIKPNLNCNLYFSTIDLCTIEIPFGAKSIRKV